MDTEEFPPPPPEGNGNSLGFKANFVVTIWLYFQKCFYLPNAPFPHITLRHGSSGILLKHEFLSSTLSCSWTLLPGVARAWQEETWGAMVLTVQIWKYMFSKAPLCGLYHHTFVVCFGSLKCSCTWCPVEKKQPKPVAWAGYLDQCLKCLDRFGVWIERTERGELFSVRACAASTEHT